MPDLPELFKDAVGDVPRFEPTTLAARARRQRRRHVGAGAASAVLIVALVIAVFGVDRSDSGDDVALHTRAGPSTLAPLTTTAPSPTLANTTTRASCATDQPATTTSASTPPSTGATLAANANPGAGDFTGTLTADPMIVHVGEPVSIAWSVRNATDHEVSPFYNPTFVRQLGPAPDNTVATMCAVLGPDGTPRSPVSLRSVHDARGLFLHLDSGIMQSGDVRSFVDTYTPASEDVGTVTCAVVVLSHAYNEPLDVLARVSAIPPATITVLPDDTATSTSTTSTTTSTPPTT